MTDPDISSSSSLEALCIEALQKVYDPELPLSIYDLGLIYEINVDAARGEVKVLMTLTNPACPVAGTLPKEVEAALVDIDGVNQAEVTLTWTPPWSKELLSPEHQLLFSTFM